MIVLGLNGSGRPGDHDAAACLLVDGRIVAFVEEERFERRKHAWHSPAHVSAAACLAIAGIGLDDVDVVAYGWDLPVKLAHQAASPPAGQAEALELLLPRTVFPRRRDPAVEFVRHHLAHAASAYYLSAAPSGAILVLDGQGERESISLAMGRGRDIAILETWPVAASLGYFYEAACEFAGLGAVHSGKLMGLAAHGTAREGLLDICDGTDPTYRLRAGVGPQELEHDNTVVDSVEIQRRWLGYFAEVWPDPPNRWHHRFDPLAGRVVVEPATDPFDFRDFAATVQQSLEAASLRLVRELLRRVDGEVVCVAGGVGYNASLNGVLLRQIGDRPLFVQPVAGDAGVALGAAAYVVAQAGGEIEALGTDLGLGQCFSPDQIRAVLDRSGLGYAQPGDLTHRVATLIAAGLVVGWFQGRSEVGPRALGHRSILATPSSPALRDRINTQVKQREVWRPFAPSIPAGALSELVDTSAPGLPYMVTTAPIRLAWAQRLAGVNHVDGTTRPQSVVAAADPLYAALLNDVAVLTGIPAVLNTSFNGRGEPLVETPAQALTAFALNGLDALAIGPYLLTAASGRRTPE